MATNKQPTTKRRSRSPRGSGAQLRDEMIAAATDLLIESGDSSAVSIRAVADRVGVTPPSIYLHFEDKDSLLEAVVAHYFEQLKTEMLTACADATTPLDAFATQGLTYVRFALQSPELYRLATMSICNTSSDVDKVLGSTAFAYFSTTVQELMDIGYYLPGDPLPVALELWSAAHGIASLMIAKPFLPWGDKIDMATRVLRSICIGHAATDFLGSNSGTAEILSWVQGQQQLHAEPHPREGDLP
ncbi:MAG: TetR/AcrR family transcriptional regulator [Mycobacteriaceae bacterium]